MSLKKGTIISHYKILSAIGKGGMGVVYLAQDSKLDRKVAIKFLSEEFSTDSDKLERFVQEAKSASALNHPNIITIYDIGDFNSDHFIVTEYIEGHTLRDKLDGKTLNFKSILDVAVQLASALVAAHCSGIVHRDVKPENIMIREDGLVKVLDFGLAKLVRASLTGASSGKRKPNRPINTMPGTILGSPAYMSPEQARGRGIDKRSDIFSFGVVLFEMLTSRRPFEENTSSKVIAKLLTKEASPISGGFPDGLERIVLRAIQKKKEDRYQSADRLLADLHAIRDEFAQKEQIDTALLSYEKRNSVYDHAGSKEVSEAILLTEFTNFTEDAVFNKTLKLALAAALEQSPYLDIFPDSSIRKALELMELDKNTVVTPEIGREICLRTGLKAIVTGAIDNLGSAYVLSMEAINGRTGETLARQVEQATRKEDVINALGIMASGLREKLGESLSSIEEFDAPFEYTTSSLEALQVYSLAYEARQKGDISKTISFLKRSIEIDPNFAYAYVGLASNYGNIKEYELAAEYARKAYQLRSRVSALEKLRITLFYSVYVTGEINKTIQTLELWKKIYPRDGRVYNNLSDSYQRIGDFERAAKNAQAAIETDNNNAISQTNYAASLIKLNRFNEAIMVCRNALESGIDGDYFHIFLFQAAFIQGDSDEMGRQLDWFRHKPNEHIALDLQTQRAGFEGRWRETQKLCKRAIKSALSNDASENAALYSSDQAMRIVLWSANRGLPATDDRKLHSALKAQSRMALGISRSKVTLPRIALAFALSGLIEETDALVSELKTRYPKDTLIKFLWLPLIRGTLDLQAGAPEKTISELKPTERFERAASFLPQFIRGLALSKSNQEQSAILEFQKIIQNPGESPLSAIYPLAQAGKAFANKNKSEYKKFFDMWTNADADMPCLVEARYEFGSL